MSMIAENEPTTKLAAKPCVDCAVVFDGDLLDDDGICLWCELIRGGEDPDFIKAEREAEEWVKSTYLRLTEPHEDDFMYEPDDRPLFLPEVFHPISYIKEGKNAAGLHEGLKHLGVELRYDTRANRAELNQFERGWLPMNDRIAATLRDILATRVFSIIKSDVTTFETQTELVDWEIRSAQDVASGNVKPLKFNMVAWGDAVNVLLAKNEVDPFVEWLEALPEWDGDPRLDLWLTRCFSINDWLPLAEWAARGVVLGAVWRAYEPGKKLDESVVLIGKGGIGKSTCLRFLLPKERDDWFSDGLYLAADNKTRAEALLGRVVCEAAELQGATRADMDSLKAFLSRQDDGSVRLAYRKDPETTLRRCVVVGTADKESPLPNDPNLRRFVPIYLDDGNPAVLRDYLDDNREQLWAEALALYRQGAEARLPDELKAMQDEALDRARSRDVLIEDAVAAWTLGNDGFTMAELASGVHLIDGNDKGARLRMRDMHRLGAVLEAMGYVKSREMRLGVKATRWFRA